ncbi:MAG: AI-2E family transporter, partial [Oscillospiraceae bacterium]|nr:AI-2E family transporter [Oscillospiraceae bacterium]
LSGVFSYIWNLVSPFVFGFIIAYCINIPVAWLEIKLRKIEKNWVKKAARPFSIIIVLGVFVGSIALGLMKIIPMIIENAKMLISEMPGYINSGIRELNRLPYAEELGFDKLYDLDISVFLQDFIPGASEVGKTVTGVFSGLFAAFLTVVATIYFLIEYNTIKSFIKRIICSHSPRRQEPALKYIRLADFSFRKFISCQFIDALILGTIVMIEFTFMKTPYAVTLGIMLGICNMIPYFGAIFGSALATFIMWATNDFKIALITAIMLLITQQIDGNFINAKIMGDSFKISPVMIVIAITVGGATGGIMGMIFAIPVVNVLKTILEEYIQAKEKQRAEQRAELAEIARLAEAQGTASEAVAGEIHPPITAKRRRP